MNQQQLDAIKARVEAAHADNGSVNLEKVKAVAEFRQHAVYDVLALVAEVERLRADASMLDWIERQLGAVGSLWPLVAKDIMSGKRIRAAIVQAKGERDD